MKHISFGAASARRIPARQPSSDAKSGSHSIIGSVCSVSARLLIIAGLTATYPQIVFARQKSIISFADEQWRVEAEPSKPRTRVTASHDRMELRAAGGVTILLLSRLSGTYCIRYDREVLSSKRPTYRVSDLNQFWLIDPSPSSSPAVRDGRLASYDSEHLFYVGIGGNNNATTRFRHYDGSQARPLLAESSLRLQPNMRYDVRTCVFPDRTELYVNGQLLFSAMQTEPPASYFAFRTVGSKQIVTHFRIERF